MSHEECGIGFTHRTLNYGYRVKSNGSGIFVFLLCCHGSGVLVAILLVGGGGGACCCHGGRGPEGGGGGWLLGGGGGGGIIPIGGGRRPTRKPKLKWKPFRCLLSRFTATWQTLITHVVSVRSWALAHGRRGRLHPGGRQTIGVGGHRRASHAGHRGREAVGSSRATRSSMHSMVVPAFSWTRAHPWRPVLLYTNRKSFKKHFFTHRRM